MPLSPLVRQLQQVPLTGEVLAHQGGEGHGAGTYRQSGIFAIGHLPLRADKPLGR